MRKKQAVKRLIAPDPRYGDVQVSRFINNVLRSGKKHIARNIVYGAFLIVEKQTSQVAIDVF